MLSLWYAAECLSISEHFLCIILMEPLQQLSPNSQLLCSKKPFPIPSCAYCSVVVPLCVQADLVAWTLWAVVSILVSQKAVHLSHQISLEMDYNELQRNSKHYSQGRRFFPNLESRMRLQPCSTATLVSFSTATLLCNLNTMAFVSSNKCGTQGEMLP